MSGPAPAPWGFEAARYASGNGDAHMYVTDANGRKIAAVWGKRDEKAATAALMIAAPDLLAALKVCLEAVAAAHADPDGGLPSPAWHWWKAARDAVAAAEGRAP